jgi:hypothetical protein
MSFRLIHGCRRLAAFSRRHMTPAASSKSSYRPPKRLNSQISKSGSIEGTSHFSTSADLNLDPTASKRLRRSESFESRPTSPTLGGSHHFAAHSSRTGLESATQMDRNLHTTQKTDSPRSSRMSRGTERPGRGGRSSIRGRPRSNADKKAPVAFSTLAGPIRDEEHIKSMETDSNLPPVKEQWLENPKSTVSNYHSLNFGKQPVYEATEALIEGRKLVRYGFS